jgi:hypothetical protein
MIWLAMLWMLSAASPSGEITHQTYSIPANEWRYVEVQLPGPARLTAEYHSVIDGDDIRVMVVRDEDLALLRDERQNSFIAESQPGPSGSLECYLPEPGRYAVVVDNREGERAASVALRVKLDSARVTFLPRKRQLIVILASFGFFFALVTWSARKLISGMRRG